MRRNSREYLTNEVGGLESDLAPWQLPRSGQSEVFCAWREAMLVDEVIPREEQRPN